MNQNPSIKVIVYERVKEEFLALSKEEYESLSEIDKAKYTCTEKVVSFPAPDVKYPYTEVVLLKVYRPYISFGYTLDDSLGRYLNEIKKEATAGLPSDTDVFCLAYMHYRPFEAGYLGDGVTLTHSFRYCPYKPVHYTYIDRFDTLEEAEARKIEIENYLRSIEEVSK